MDKNDATRKEGVSLDTTNFDYIEQIADRNQEEVEKEERDLAKEEGRDPAEWAKELSKEEKELRDKKEITIEKEEEIIEKKEEIIEKEEEAILIVDGVETKVSLSKIIDAGKRTLQKETAADKRLEEATRILKEAKETKETKKLSETDAIKEISEESLSKLRRDYIHASQYGTEDEMLAALIAWETSIKTIGTKETSTIPKISTEEVKKAIKEVDLETRLNALPEDGGYSDLLSNPILRDQTKSLVDSLVINKKGSYDSFDTYKQAGDAIRLIGNSIDSTYTPPKIEVIPKDSFDDKRESKKTITNLKSASAKIISKTKKDDDKEESLSSIISEIKKARGQG
jgi:hypothetical protein